MAEGFTFKVPQLEAPLRLDLFLIRHFPGSGRKYWRESLEGGAKIDGRPASKGQTLRGGEEIWLREAPTTSKKFSPNPGIDLEILYEDEALFAVLKPAGMPSHPLKASESGTAVNAVLARFPGQTKMKPPREAGLVHRLDNETSGVLLFAKTPEALAALRSMSQSGKMRKVYLARVAGNLSGQGEIDSPIGHAPKNAKKMRVAPSPKAAKTAKARPALTRYRRLENDAASSLLEVEIAVGARHQIRIHLAALGHPLIGDTLYGGPKAKRLALHALEIHFEHPFSGEKTSIVAPLPKDFP